MHWAELEQRQPALAAKGRKLLMAPGVLLVGTIRSDGAPRISPVEPLVMAGDLWLSMLLGSQKAKDLLRDPRILVQSITTSPDGKAGEFRIRGSAPPMDDDATISDYAATVAREIGWQPVPGQFHLFRIEIDTVTYIRYENGDQYLTAWPDGGETVRRAITPTSLGPAEPTRQLLKDESATGRPATT